jgi:hypothetical protein
MTRRVLYDGWALVAGLLVLGACAPASRAADKKADPVGTWEIKGKDAGGSEWTGLMVLTAKKDGRLAGSIDWQAKGGNADGAYEDELSEDGSRLVKGKWADAGDGTWTARRTRKVAKPAKSAAEEGTGWVERVYTGPKGEKFTYVVFIPKKYKKDGDDTYPVIVFLHGSGEGGNDGWKATTAGIGPVVEANQDTFPFIVVFPQSPDEPDQPFEKQVKSLRDFKEKHVVGILDDVLKAYRGDQKRVSLPGVSVGGVETWEIAARYPTAGRPWCRCPPTGPWP